ncbi:MAG: hypothetical protein FJ363_09505 [Gemmatimonadetes bacterium]|nr:hypothetical protein [Gemmatimonadota bacterium]
MTVRNQWVRDGLVVGLIAYAAVAVFYSGFDLLASRGTLFTVNLLGQGLFHGLRDPSVLLFPVPVDLQVVFWYNTVHLVLSLAIGLLVLWLVELAEQNPARAGLMAGFIITGFAITVAVIGRLTEPMRALLPWWSIVVANGAATACAAFYLLRRRPGLGRRMFG